jgi:hypothetical protein
VGKSVGKSQLSKIYIDNKKKHTKQKEKRRTNK